VVSVGGKFYAKENLVSSAIVASLDRLVHCLKESENAASTGSRTGTRGTTGAGTGSCCASGTNRPSAPAQETRRGH